MKLITVKNNRIEFGNHPLTGKETVSYNGKTVSEKFSMGGSIHVFTVEEEKETATYEVEFQTRWHGMSFYNSVRRNGIIVFTDK